jgi:hypothetical protein
VAILALIFAMFVFLYSGYGISSSSTRLGPGSSQLAPANPLKP